MIIKTFDYGWGPQWPVKKLEQELLTKFLLPLQNSREKAVVINSVWYGHQQHQQTLEWLRDNQWDSIALVSLLDAAIPYASWFQEFGKPVYEIGGYHNQHYISLWAEMAYRYISPYLEHDIDCPFMCLNRKPHWHRVRFYQQLKQEGVIEMGMVSMGGHDTQPAMRRLSESIDDNLLAPGGDKKYHGIANDIGSLGDLSNWRRHFLNLVTETVYDINKHYFVSEKIFKPILGARPFLVYDPGGAENWLHTNGFRSYLADFQDISDLDLRDPNNLAPFLATLCQQTPAYWKKKYIDLLPKISYNLDRFNSFVNEQRQRINKGIQCQI